MNWTIAALGVLVLVLVLVLLCMRFTRPVSKMIDGIIGAFLVVHFVSLLFQLQPSKNKKQNHQKFWVTLLLILGLVLLFWPRG